MNFPLIYRPSLDDCYNFLLSTFHPDGLACPNGHSIDNCKVHKCRRKPIIDYRCQCGRCFNLFTGTVLQGTKLSVMQIVLCFDGLVRGSSIASIAKDICIGRKGTRNVCNKIREIAFDIKKNSSKRDWKTILENIVMWEFEDSPEPEGGKSLIVRVKNGKCYSLTRKSYKYYTHDNKSGAIKYSTMVKPKKINYLSLVLGKK